MQLLDVTLAFALTLAALATVVTTVMEICLRFIRMRKKNFISVLQLLNRELGNGYLKKISDDERWTFFVRVLKNPAMAARAMPTQTVNNQKLEEYLAGMKKRKFLAGVFETVSLEYLLRCLAECDFVKKASREAGETIKAEFNRIARKYEEFSSSVSAGFKQNSQRWSIIIGVGLAFAANIDGLRIFQAYRTDPGLVAAVVEKQDEFLQKNQEVQAAIKELNNFYEKFDDTEKRLTEAIRVNSPNIEKLEKEKQELEEAIAKRSDIAEIHERIESSRKQVANLVTLGVPIGWDFYPNCPYGKTERQWAMSGIQCQTIPEEARDFNESKYHYRAVQTLAEDFTGFVAWLFNVMISGILIGLGAPFWFDVAKRLSQIRKGFQSASASTEYRFSARNANGDPKMRRKIVETVLADAQETAKSDSTIGEFVQIGPRLGPKAMRL